ncbi:MAG: Hint domain-containing protein [Pseudomonadota bacterium]
MPATMITLDVYAATDVVFCDGVMQGETLTIADELVMDDVFEIAVGAQLSPLSLHSDATGLQMADGDGNDVHLDCCLTLMAPDGSTHEALVLVEVEDGAIVSLSLLPLGELLPQTPYRLVGIARQTATRRFAEAASGSFARGTRITMGDGRMYPIEDLQPGDILLTRDAGRQPVRHIGQTTLRATGSFAPVVITPGALNNERELVLRPDHRLFIYQRTDELGTGRAEVLIKARHLVDQSSVIRRRGGFIDYFQLIMDAHHIIYAEGIAAESHLIDPRTRAALPEGLAAPDHAEAAHQAYEVKGSLIPAKEAAALLRRASTS